MSVEWRLRSSQGGEGRVGLSCTRAYGRPGGHASSRAWLRGEDTRRDLFFCRSLSLHERDRDRRTQFGDLITFPQLCGNGTKRSVTDTQTHKSGETAGLRGCNFRETGPSRRPLAPSNPLGHSRGLLSVQTHTRHILVPQLPEGPTLGQPASRSAARAVKR